ncbi:MAG TPA: glycosyltransferase family 9 protein [Candidatus Hydrogenedens sp.]|nr:glycosyltransferase family 9 protein [Candidatus Hydrogenedens sp.]HPP58778.1 glycosyltransferase family 9 protein [Candidatus Hydrogenedens sp.]
MNTMLIPKQHISKILIIRLSAIGDVIRVIPAMEAIRIAYPDAQIDWVVENKACDVINEHPALNNCIIFDRTNELMTSLNKFLTLCRHIRQNRYDLVLDFHGILKSGLISFFSKAPYRISFAPPRAQELSYIFATHRVSLPKDRILTRVEENFFLAEAIGAEKIDDWLGMLLPAEIEEEIQELLQTLCQTNRKLIIIHPPVERPEKQWQFEHFAKLADLLIADGRFEVLFTWGPGQLDVIRQITKRMQYPVLVSPQLPTLKHLACLISHSSVFISGDTGPMHLAWLLHQPAICIFGGTNPQQHAPHGTYFKVLYKGPIPFPKKMTLHQAQEALKQITPDEVFKTVLELTQQINSS